MEGVGILVVPPRGVTFRFWSHFNRVFWAKRHHNYLAMKVSFRKYKKLYIVCVLTWFRPDRSPLGV